MAVAVGKGVTPLPPAQIPACGFLAPGSLDSLAPATTTAIPLSEVSTPPGPPCPVRCFLWGLRLPVSPFPLWTALPSPSTMDWSDSLPPSALLLGLSVRPTCRR